LEDVASAEEFVLWAEPKGRLVPGGNRHIETGYALALGKRMSLIGQPELEFHSIVREQYDSALDFIDALAAREDEELVGS